MTTNTYKLEPQYLESGKYIGWHYWKLQQALFEKNNRWAVDKLRCGIGFTTFILKNAQQIMQEGNYCAIDLIEQNTSVVQMKASQFEQIPYYCEGANNEGRNENYGVQVFTATSYLRCKDRRNYENEQRRLVVLDESDQMIKQGGFAVDSREVFQNIKLYKTAPHVLTTTATPFDSTVLKKEGFAFLNFIDTAPPAPRSIYNYSNANALKHELDIALQRLADLKKEGVDISKEKILVSTNKASFIRALKIKYGQAIKKSAYAVDNIEALRNGALNVKIITGPTVKRKLSTEILLENFSIEEADVVVTNTAGSNGWDGVGIAQIFLFIEKPGYPIKSGEEIQVIGRDRSGDAIVRRYATPFEDELTDWDTARFDLVDSQLSKQQKIKTANIKEQQTLKKLTLDSKDGLEKKLNRFAFDYLKAHPKLLHTDYLRKRGFVYVAVSKIEATDPFLPKAIDKQAVKSKTANINRFNNKDFPISALYKKNNCKIAKPDANELDLLIEQYRFGKKISLAAFEKRLSYALRSFSLASDPLTRSQKIKVACLFEFVIKGAIDRIFQASIDTEAIKEYILKNKSDKRRKLEHEGDWDVWSEHHTHLLKRADRSKKRKGNVLVFHNGAVEVLQLLGSDYSLLQKKFETFLDIIKKQRYKDIFKTAVNVALNNTTFNDRSKINGFRNYSPHTRISTASFVEIAFFFGYPIANYIDISGCHFAQLFHKGGVDFEKYKTDFYGDPAIIGKEAYKQNKINANSVFNSIDKRFSPKFYGSPKFKDKYKALVKNLPNKVGCLLWDILFMSPDERESDFEKRLNKLDREILPFVNTGLRFSEKGTWAHEQAYGELCLVYALKKEIQRRLPKQAQIMFGSKHDSLVVLVQPLEKTDLDIFFPATSAAIINKQVVEAIQTAIKCTTLHSVFGGTARNDDGSFVGTSPCFKLTAFTQSDKV